MMAPFPLDERIKLAAHLTVRARVFYDLWWLYKGQDTRPKIIAVMNRYPNFFRFDTHAHFVALVMDLAGLFEAGRYTINFGALIKASQPHIEHQAHESAKKLLAGIRPVSSRLKVLRDHLFAHRSASLSYKDAFVAAQIAPNQLRDLITNGFQLVNILLAARGLRTEPFHDLERTDHDLARTDAEALLDDLAKMHASSYLH